jgi:hypothetical protein
MNCFRIFSLVSLLAFAFALTMAAQAAPPLTFTEEGVKIDVGSAGTFTLAIPELSIQGQKPEKATVTPDSGTGGVAKYPSGAQLKYSIDQAKGQVGIHFSRLPEGARHFRFTMHVPIRYNQGGSWAFDGAELQKIPLEKKEQFVQAGNAHAFHVVSPSGKGISIKTPGGWQGFQDNRVFNWPIYVYIYQFDIGKRTEGHFSFEIKDRATGDAPAFLVDRFGQSALKEYPRKVKDIEELKRDAEAEKAELAKPFPVSLDSYGGLAGSGEKYGLRKTGFFHVARINDRQVLVTPEGNVFFHNGVCTLNSVDDFTLVKGREDMYEEIPEKNGPLASAWRESTPGVVSFYIANWVRKFGKPWTREAWLDQTIDRLRAWGFNSVGSFSGYSPKFEERNFPYVMNLGVESTPGVNALPGRIGAGRLLDPFAPGTEEALDRHYAKSVAARAGEKLLIGYYLGNEQHFESLPKLIPTYKSDVHAKVRLVKLLQDKYESVDRFNAAWNPPEPFKSFEEMKDAPLHVSTEQAAEDMREYFRLYLESYYGAVTRAFRKHDPNHLIIGSRWTPGTASNEDVVRIGGAHVDVLSVNYYTYSIEPEFLNRVHRWGGEKPIILSEWHFCVTDQGLAASREVKDQKDRGLAFKNYLQQAAASPYVVGSEWFSFLDQSITGRFFEGFNGEGNNIGLVNVVDRPYKEFIALVKETNEQLYDVKLGLREPFAYQDPRFQPGSGASNKVVSIPRALPEMKQDGTTNGWPGRPAEPIDPSRLTTGTPEPKLRGDFRLCWDEQFLHFLVQVKDPTPARNQKENGSLWLGDAVELFIGGSTTRGRSFLVTGICCWGQGRRLRCLWWGIRRKARNARHSSRRMSQGMVMSCRSPFPGKY